MKLLHTRTQHPIGQGFFHTGEVSTQGGKSVRYVVDCGSMGMYASARNREVSRAVNTWGVGTRVDFLFVSHAHADHVNGLHKLFEPTAGLRVDTIFMPLLSIEERLIAYARTSAEDPSAASDGFYRTFALDPVTALAQLEPNRIVLVRRGTPGEGAPYANPDAGVDGPSGAPLLMGDQHNWKPVGSGVISEQQTPLQNSEASANGQAEETDRPGKSPTVLEMPDTVAILISGEDGVDWLLSPYVDPSVRATRRKFLGKLAARLGLPPKTLAKQVASSSFVLDLLTKHESALRQAYVDVERDINLTSMCVYSGPARQPIAPRQLATAARHAHSDLRVRWGGPRCGWLGTGDADLKASDRRKNFTQHYGLLLRNVMTLTLPHHGSEHNFHIDLLARVHPIFCVAAADKVGRWRHPGSAVVQAVATYGSFVSVVTSGQRSRVHECAYVY